ncbi:TM0106 family RecB-like putative nuclease [uncultured Brevundimonas sp.]|uniref:TM0106 family RecB-like putative nuclease n=1 Tax=uncultured Brevundimonas sp. TaxID=213418 RepID=UPI0030EF1970
MKYDGDDVRLSATDLVGHLNCRHLTEQDRAVARGSLPEPKVWDPALEALWERGKQHEASYVDHLTDQGLEIVTIDGVDITPEAVAETTAAMQAGKAIILQGALRTGAWAGRTDVLRRIETPSALGDWSYEVEDTKLARETKGSTVLQISLYSDLLADVQGRSPELMHVVAPYTDFTPETFRTADFAAYYRVVRRSLEAAVANPADGQTYPEPNPFCEICRWRDICDQRRRADDHLSLVAGISKNQMVELVERAINTTAALATMPVPISWKPERGAASSYVRVREQARVQLQARETGASVFELLDHQEGFGLSRLPAPSSGDVFLDFESDPFVGEHGLEYLLGYEHQAEDGQWTYTPLWALTRADEKAAFEQFIDFIMARWDRFPDLHIYHFGGYETGALKRLMGRYATREDALDRILRGLLTVDLLSVTRQSLRAGVESYSLKKLEPLYGFMRDTSLPDARLALTRLQTSLELNDLAAIDDADRATVQAYNREDCVSTRHLRGWLEELRAERVAGGADIARPDPGDGAPSEKVGQWLATIAPLVEALTGDVPADPLECTQEQHGRWLLANMLEWHRREDKATWWEFFRLKDLTAAELIDEKSALSGLTFEGIVGGTPAAPIHRYRFPPQDTDVRPGKALQYVGGHPMGAVEDISSAAQTVDIKTRKDTAALHPEAVFVHEYVSPEPMQLSLVRLATHVVAHGMAGEGPYAAARALLMRYGPPLLDGADLRIEGETTLDAARRIATHLAAGVLPIQGPPGTGKTYTAAHMICALVAQGKTVGVVANGHTVIRNLLNAVVEAADETGVDVQCVQKPKEKEDDSHRMRIVTRTADLFAALGVGCHVAGGTAWLWSSPDAFQTVDVLFVDEAAQMSLANVLAVSQAASTLVLVGDPQQLDQPTQGSHPEGTECSALHHLLNGKQTIAPEEGLFLEETWRLCPSICDYTSELFYESKLSPRPGSEAQAIVGAGAFSGSGLRFVSVPHSGNQSSSLEEAAAIAAIVKDLVDAGASWIDRKGSHPLTLEDILIIAPYNAQVYEIQRRIPGAKVGTVDKFQGQEAAIAIYSMATSSHADAPRGMEFLYSPNRLNVATSRAKCLSIMVGSPSVFEADCRTPRQMQLANAFCRYLEVAS